MTTATGWSDSFGRTVSNGFGTATSGQAYSLLGTATQFSVAPNTASIAISAAGDNIGYIDMQTQSLDVTGQVALSAVPASNLATVGFTAKITSNLLNWFNGTMMVATGGAVSLRFSKLVAGSLVTISTTAVAGLTYVANTFYNLRYQIYWSQVLQTNVMSLKLWAVGTTEPGGWMATATDASLTQYTSGTQVGLHGRDESSVLGTITTKHRSVVARSFNLPMPAATDPMCYDPAVTYPKQTVLQSLAAATDAAMATMDPLTSLAGLFPRVRVSNSNFQFSTAPVTIVPTYAATEFNIGTPTNLSLDAASLRLGVGIWLITFEIQLKEAASDSLLVALNGPSLSADLDVQMRSNAVQSNDLGVGGCAHVSALGYWSNPSVNAVVNVTLFPNNVATTYTATYMALSAIKISDYFA